MGFSRRMVVLVGIAFLMAMLVAFLVSSLFTGGESPQPVVVEKPTTEILVAGKAMLPGEKVRPGDLAWREWHSETVPSEFFTREILSSGKEGIPVSDDTVETVSQTEQKEVVEGVEGGTEAPVVEESLASYVEGEGNSSEETTLNTMDTLASDNGEEELSVTDVSVEDGVPLEIPEGFTGSYARTEIVKGEPITARKLVIVGKEGGSMAALLKPGMRAVALAIEPEDAAGGFIYPNDHVDILLTRALGPSDDTLSSGGDSYMTSAVLTNVRVLAIGAERNLAEDSRKSQEGVLIEDTATLELNPRGAEILSMAGSMGRLSLALRSAADSDEERAAFGAVQSWSPPKIYRFGNQQ